MIGSSFQKFFIISFILPLLFQNAAAFDIPEPSGFVTDLAQVFSYEEEMAIEVRIQEIEENTTAEIGLLVIPTTDGEAISSVAFDVGNLWGVGKKKNDNGLVIVIATQDRAWFMATGYGLEGALPDAITKRIAEKHFPPHFREGNYADGVLDALDDVESYLKRDPTIVAEYDGASSSSSADATLAVWFMILVALAIAKSIWVASSDKKKRIGRSVTGTILLFFIGMATTIPIAAAIIAGLSALIDLLIISGVSGGSGSAGSSGSFGSSSWGSSSGGGSSGGGSFGGGSFGGGGSGGRW